jgi:D-alanyl-D-alanine carboxypeptidase
VPGAAVGVWVPGKGTWIGAAGLADLKTNAPVTKDMIWPLRSITKSFTVTLILQLADEGKLSLDDPIDKYVSGVTAVRRLPCASSPACRAATPTM